MPHMANLSWMPLFIVLNLSLMALYFSMKMSNIYLNQKEKQTNPTHKKWQW